MTVGACYSMSIVKVSDDVDVCSSATRSTGPQCYMSSLMAQARIRPSLTAPRSDHELSTARAAAKSVSSFELAASWVWHCSESVTGAWVSIAWCTQSRRGRDDLGNIVNSRIGRVRRDDKSKLTQRIAHVRHGNEHMWTARSDDAAPCDNISCPSQDVDTIFIR